ncbi:energy-coupling factor transporter transmembrane component T family protein [Corynebacterium sp. 335C]
MARLPIPLSVYVHADSPLHRAPAMAKLGGVVAFIIATTFLAGTLPLAAAALAVAALGYVVGRIPQRTAAWQMFGAVPLLAFIAVIQGFTVGWHEAGVMFLSVLACVIAATLITLTTRVSDLMDAFDRLLAPLARFGVPVATISLAMSLTLRLIPLQVKAVEEALDARRARGGGASPAAFGVPVVIRTVRRSQAMADALIARGVGDD